MEDMQVIEEFGVIPGDGDKELKPRGEANCGLKPILQEPHQKSPETGRSGRQDKDDQSKLAAAENGKAGVHENRVSQREPDLRFADPLVAEIVETWRSRQDMVRAQQKLTLQIKAICRRFCAGDKAAAEKLYKAIQEDFAHPAAIATYALFEARKPLEAARAAYEKHLAKLGNRLPIAHVCETIKGVNTKTLASIVGECGDLSAYPTVHGVWKRAGLGVIEGGRQRKVAGQAALAHGYNAERHAVFWNISAALIKSQGKGEDAGEYRRIYDARKEYERLRVETDGHAHNRAMRYMAKALLKHLTLEWRRASAVDGWPLPEDA